jgi:hypothetical protein
MTFDDVFSMCCQRGVRLVIRGGELRAQGKPGAVSEPLKRALTEHKHQIVEAFGDGIWPDETLPDVLVIPASTRNTENSIKACIDAQRRQQAA